MKIGGYKDNPNASDIDLSEPVQDTTNEGGEVAAQEGAQEQPSQPEIQDTSKEIQETGQFDKPQTTETAGNAEEDKSSLNTEQSGDSTNEPTTGNTGEGQPSGDDKGVNTPAEISDEQHLKYLSEKLGREINSFDDLTKAEAQDNPLESDPYLKELAEWRKKTNRPIEDWIKFQKDYSKVSDADVAREFLQLEYPELSQEEIELELNSKYLSSEDDLDSEASLKNLELKKLASKGRKELQNLVSEFGEPNLNNYTPEVQQDLEIAKKYKESVKQSEVANQQYQQNISAKANDLKSIKLDLAEGLSIDYKLPEGSNKNLVDTINEAPHWRNEDGSWNHEAIVRDTAIISNFDNMLKLAYEQGKNSGAEEVVKDAKNTTLDNKGSGSSASPQAGKGIQVEGLDKYLGNKGMSIVRGNR